MDEIDNRAKLAQCRCGKQFTVNYVHYKGGINDKGGVIIECPACHSFMAVNVQNPDEVRSVDFKIVNTWDDEMPQSYNEFYNLNYPVEQIETTRQFINEMTESNNPLPSTNPFWGDFHQNIFPELEPQITREYQNYYNFYIKGKEPDIDKSFIVINSEGRRVIFAKSIRNESDLSVKSLRLIHDSSINYCSEVDGIYQRDEAKRYLESMLHRWRLLCKQVVVATPFIGFSYNGKQLNETVQLWEWLDSCIDVEKTTFITRRSSFNTMKKQFNTQVFNTYPVLEKWGLLDNLTRQCSSSKFIYTQNFHAKIYAGIYADKVELIAGSYNIHTGKYLENISLRNVSRERFLNSYMKILRKDFNYSSDVQEHVHVICIDDTRVTSNKSITLNDFYNKYIK